MLQEHWWDWWFLWPILVLTILFFVIIGIVIKRGIGQQGSKSEESALDVLKKRYARGEVSKEEFEEKKRHIA
jgi:putative membrane protein